MTLETPALPAPPKTVKTIFVSPTGNDTHDGLTPATAWRTPKAVDSGLTLLLQGGVGSVYSTKGLMLNGLTDVAIGAWYQTSHGPIETSVVGAALPTLFGEDGCNLFSFNAATARILISNLKCDSNWDAATTAGKYAYHAPKACWGNVRGQDIALVGLALANLAEGVVAAQVTRMSLSSVVQVEPLGMPARCLMVDDATDLTVSGCTFLNSVNESPLRATGNGVTRGLFTGNKISQLLDQSHGRASAKAAVTIRQATGLAWVNNTVVNGELSFTSDHTGRQLVTDVLISGGSVTGSLLRLCNGASKIEVDGLSIDNQTGSECVSDSAGIAGIVYDQCSFKGASSGIKFYAESDAVVETLKWTPSKPGLPAIKAADGVDISRVAVSPAVSPEVSS